MKILVCSDGHPQAENAIRFIAGTAAACDAEVILLGIIEHPSDEASLLDALRRGASILRDKHVAVEMVTRTGDPIEEIQKRTQEENFDLVVIGAEQKSNGGPFALSTKVYHLIKEVEPPVLVMIGKRPNLQHILICSGGKRYIDNAVRLTGQIACKSHLNVTILHVMAEPPAIYTNMIASETDVSRLLSSNSALGRNLRSEQSALESTGVKASIKLRHGLVVREILTELKTGDYDMVVTGSALAGGALRTYIMGDVTSEIVNRAQRPVLVVRGGEEHPSSGFFGKLLHFFSSFGGNVNSKT